MADSISLDAKQDSVVVISQARSLVPVGTALQVPCQYANGVLVDVICDNYTGVVEIWGNNGSAWVREPDPNASKAVSATTRYAVLNVAQVVTAAITSISGSGSGGITVILTPFIAAASAVVNITGSPQVSIADGQDVAQGSTTDTAVTSDAPGTISAKLRGLVALLAGVVNLAQGWLRVQPQPTTWNLVGTSAANTAQTVTQAAAGAGLRNYLSGLTVSWSGGAPAADANVQVKDGATVIWDAYIGQAGGTQGVNDYEFTQPLRGSVNTAMSVTVAAGGSGVTTKVSAQGTVGR
ncbi:MAG: hypothetical protein ACM3US_07305 [Sphingomonadaceae bacterium]